MSESLTVSVKQGKSGFEGTVQVPGLKATKLTRKDGSTSFPTSSAVKTVARSVGKRLSLDVRYDEPAKKAAKVKAKKATKPAAKKATKPKAKKAAPAPTTPSTTCN